MIEYDYVRVPKNLKTKIEKFDSEDEKLKAFNEYIESVRKKSRDDYKGSLQSLDEDLAIYNGLMLKSKKAFQEAKEAQLDASYALWERFEKELPSTKSKIKQITETLNPLKEQLYEINNLFSKINTYDLEKTLEIIYKISGAYGKNKEILEFVIKNFKSEK